jgi:hypothetical protein
MHWIDRMLRKKEMTSDPRLCSLWKFSVRSCRCLVRQVVCRCSTRLCGYWVHCSLMIVFGRLFVRSMSTPVKIISSLVSFGKFIIAMDRTIGVDRSRFCMSVCITILSRSSFVHLSICVDFGNSFDEQQQTPRVRSPPGHRSHHRWFSSRRWFYSVSTACEDRSSRFFYSCLQNFQCWSLFDFVHLLQ